jgi:hypothetical protein
MRICSLTVMAAIAATLAACSGSSSSTPVPVEVAAATIGPDGGEIEVFDGAQAGLKLTIPPGALSAPTRIRVIDESPTLPPEVLATTYAPLIGLPFRIEPDDVVTTQDVTLRLPYRPGRIYETSRSNVRARQTDAFATSERRPDSVDVEAGLMEVRLRGFGAFRAVLGPRFYDPLSYLPPLDEVAELEGGYQFSIEEGSAPLVLPFANVTRWRITGPNFDESLLFDGPLLLARESDRWREIWGDSYNTFTRPPNAVSNGAIFPMEVEAPLGGPVTQGEMIAVGYREFGAPIMSGRQLALDVLKLTIDLNFDQGSLGTGTREYTFWFSPEHGLLALAIDGVRRDRLQ